MEPSNRLALYGGPKVRTNPMPSRMAFGTDELRAIEELFGYYKNLNVDFGYQGEYERLYTDAFVNYMGVTGFADAVCTGTAALFVAIASLQIEPGSHVMVSPVTDPGTISAIIINQLVPVLMDSEQNSYNIGIREFEERITDKTKAVVVVHTAGKTAPINMITNIARERGIYVIEDCSQAHGAKLKGQKVGTFGDIAAFSTMYKKAHITGGCGGVIFTRNEKLYNLSRAFADRGKPFFKDDFDDKDPSSFLFPALNLNIDEISCAIGGKTLGKLDETIQKRVVFLQELGNSLSKQSKICKLANVSIDDSPFFQPIVVDISKISCSKNEVAEAIRAEGIDINPNYKYVVCEWSWVKKYLFDNFECKNAIQYRESTFNLLFNENYGKRELRDIVTAIVKVEKAFLLR